MHQLPRTAIVMLLLGSATPLLASSVFRCQAPNGHVTYTLQGCMTDQQQYIQQAFNPTPSSGAPVTLGSKTRHRESQSEAQNSLEKVTVVGQRDDGCGNRIVGRERREAVIKRHIRPGMTRADVESALGAPDRVTGNNGRSRYLYRDGGRTRQISFDENGCVTDKR